MFYTRIPVGKNLPGSSEDLNRATVFLPFIGLIVGAISATAYAASVLIFPSVLAVIIAIAAGVLCTGAFHEDGFADTCDGLGGGFTVKDKLRIMKDSRVGTYGLIGLILVLSLKIAALAMLPPGRVVFTFLSTHILARVIPLFLIRILNYVREDEQSKVKPVSKGIGIGGLFIAMLLSVALFTASYLLLSQTDLSLFLLLLLPLLIAPLMAWYFHRTMGGYTGDLLGAAEQVGEFAVPLATLLL